MTSRTELFSDLFILDGAWFLTFGFIGAAVVAGMLMMHFTSDDEGDLTVQSRPEAKQLDAAPTPVALEESQPEPPRFAA